MVMRRRARPWRKTRLGQALLLNARVSMGQELADLRAIFGCKGGEASDVLNVHGGEETSMRCTRRSIVGFTRRVMLPSRGA